MIPRNIKTELIDKLMSMTGLSRSSVKKNITYSVRTYGVDQYYEAILYKGTDIRRCYDGFCVANIKLL
jgi:hypothetical protein